MGIDPLFNLIRRGIADIMDRVMMLLLEEVHLEGQDGEEFVDIALDVLDAVFLPRPDLRGDIVIDGYLRLGLHELGDIQVEAGVVDKDDAVGLPVEDVQLTHFHITEDGGQMEQHGDEAHIGQFAIVAHPSAADRHHQVTAEEAEVGLTVYIFQRLHQMGGVQVAGGFASNQIVFHKR